MPSVPLSMAPEKHINTTVPGTLLCSAALLLSCIEGWLLVGARAGSLQAPVQGNTLGFLENTCKIFGYHQSVISNPQTLCGIRCGPVLASHAKRGTPAK